MVAIIKLSVVFILAVLCACSTNGETSLRPSMGHYNDVPQGLRSAQHGYVTVAPAGIQYSDREAYVLLYVCRSSRDSQRELEAIAKDIAVRMKTILETIELKTEDDNFIELRPHRPVQSLSLGATVDPILAPWRQIDSNCGVVAVTYSTTAKLPSGSYYFRFTEEWESDLVLSQLARPMDYEWHKVMVE